MRCVVTRVHAISLFWFSALPRLFINRDPTVKHHQISSVYHAYRVVSSTLPPPVWWRWKTVAAVKSHRIEEDCTEGRTHAIVTLWKLEILKWSEGNRNWHLMVSSHTPLKLRFSSLTCLPQVMGEHKIKTIQFLRFLSPTHCVYLVRACVSVKNAYNESLSNNF